jgi:hypothetical protein
MASTAPKDRIVPIRPGIPAPEVRPALRAAFVLSWVIVGLMAVISLLGLTVDHPYRDGAWADEAFRGADLITLAVALPLLATATVLARRGSARATAVWMGMLGYVLYNYAFAVFGANFNDVFLLHIAVFSCAVYALACGVPSLDVLALGERLRTDRWARFAGAFLVIVGVLQGGLWVFLIVRNAVTGELLAEIPVRGQHVVFALDLSLMMPALVIGGVLLWRRRVAGFLLGTAVAVLGAVYTLNGLAAGWFQAHADVPGTKAFAPDAIALTIAMFVPAVLLLLGPGRRSGPTGV